MENTRKWKVKWRTQAWNPSARQSRIRAVRRPLVMPFSLPEGTFPTLNLSLSTKQALIDQAYELVRETILTNEEFMTNGRTLPPAVPWKLIKSKRRFQVFRERRGRSSTGAGAKTAARGEAWKDDNEYLFNTASTVRLSRDSSSILCPRDHLPMTLGFGTIQGTLDDTMYGAFAADDDAWRIKSSYVEDRFDDAKVLATIYGPSEQDPYRFLGVKWFTNELPLGVGALIQRRDFLILEATGLARDSQGTQVGYSVYQSIDLPQIPELKTLKIVRGYTSCCFINRQLTPTTVGIYCRGFFDAGGYLSSSMSASMAANSIVAAANALDCAVMKKLVWLVGQTQEEHLAASRVQSKSSLDQCETCRKPVNKFGRFLPGSSCRLCRAVSHALTLSVSDHPCLTMLGSCALIDRLQQVQRNQESCDRRVDPEAGAPPVHVLS